MTFYEFIKSVCMTAFVENRELCIALIVIFVCMLLIHLLIRPYRLWYWKINKTNKEITEQLKELNTKVEHIEMITEGKDLGFGGGSENEHNSDENGDTHRADDDAGDADGGSHTEDADKSEEPFENGETISTSFGDKKNSIMSRGYDTDKQGKIYTEEEITKLIKD